MTSQRPLRLLDLVFMNLVIVASLRWIAAAASNGPSSLVLWALAALFFFIPESLSVAELSSRFPGEGGLYRWTQRAFGERHGFLCGWCYWVNNILYFPAMLLYVSANVAFALKWARPEWALPQQKAFVVVVTLGTLWMVAGLSIIGMRAGRWVQNLGSFGNWVPALVVAVLGGLAWLKYGSANPLTVASIKPRIGDWSQLVFFSQMCFAFAGMELVSFVGGEIENPRKNITRGILLAAIAIFAVYFIGTLGILLAVPSREVTLINGVLLPIEEMGKRWNLSWLAGGSAGLLALGGVGAVMAWFSGVARLPYLVGVDRFLPERFGDLHPHFGTPYVAILVQTAVSTAFTLFATIGASTRLETAYQILVNMCLVLYFIPFCYLFLSILKLGKTELPTTEEASKLYLIPGGYPGKCVIAVTGLLTTIVAITTSVLPMSDANGWVPALQAAAGTLLMIGIGVGLYVRGRRHRVSILDSFSIPQEAR